MLLAWFVRGPWLGEADFGRSAASWSLMPLVILVVGNNMIRSECGSGAETIAIRGVTIGVVLRIKIADSCEVNLKISTVCFRLSAYVVYLSTLGISESNFMIRTRG